MLRHINNTSKLLRTDDEASLAFGCFTTGACFTGSEARSPAICAHDFGPLEDAGSTVGA